MERGVCESKLILSCCISETDVKAEASAAMNKSFKFQHQRTQRSCVHPVQSQGNVGM